MRDGEGPAESGRRVRRRDRHGRGLRGVLTPAELPLHRSRAERFDDLVLQAVARLEPRWEAELAGVEFAVEEVPRADLPDDDPEPVPLARLDRGSADPGQPSSPAHAQPAHAQPAHGRPARIVLYRRPLLARADGEEELGELVLDVVVEEVALLLGLDPEVVDPGYPAED